MPSSSTLALVVLAAAVLWMVPGPALLLLLARGIDLGIRGAVATALGLGLGTTVHVLGAALGLSAVLAASATAFSVVKFAGGAYLVWLGVRRLRDRRPLLQLQDAAPPRDDGRAFREGFTINARNPKVGDVAFAALAGSLGRVWVTRLGAAGPFQRLGRPVIGALYIGLGMVTILASDRPATAPAD